MPLGFCSHCLTDLEWSPLFPFYSSSKHTLNVQQQDGINEYVIDVVFWHPFSPLGPRHSSPICQECWLCTVHSWVPLPGKPWVEGSCLTQGFISRLPMTSSCKDAEAQPLCLCWLKNAQRESCELSSSIIWGKMRSILWRQHLGKLWGTSPKR